MRRRLLFTLVAVALVFGALEGLCRALEPGLTEGTIPMPFPGTRTREFDARITEAREAAGSAVPLVYDESSGWTLPPSRTEAFGATVMRYNALGMRGPDWPPPKPGEVRILSLGDSSIFGLGVMESQVFNAVAAEELAARWTRDVVGVIGGIPGFTTTQALSLQARVEAGIGPSWVVIGCLWSDVLHPGTAPEIAAPSPFATYRVARLFLAPWLTTQKVRFLDSRADVSTPGGEARTGLDRYAANLRALAERALADGAKPAFLLLPAPLDLDAAAPPENVSTYRAAMRGVAAAMNAPLVDGVALAKERGATLAWWSDQVHPSSLGHRELGLALAEALAPIGPPPAGQTRYPAAKP
jgi:lysophospholipase L1-like esterase